MTVVSATSAVSHSWWPIIDLNPDPYVALLVTCSSPPSLWFVNRSQFTDQLTWPTITHFNKLEWKCTLSQHNNSKTLFSFMEARMKSTPQRQDSHWGLVIITIVHVNINNVNCWWGVELFSWVKVCNTYMYMYKNKYIKKIKNQGTFMKLHLSSRRVLCKPKTQHFLQWKVHLPVQD